MSSQIEKIVVITKKTALEELIERFNTSDQARFYLQHMGISFDEYQKSHDVYRSALEILKTSIPRGIRAQFIERSFLPNIIFGKLDLLVTLGPDGLVVNTAKYLNGHLIVALNPDSERVDGILVPFNVEEASSILHNVMDGKCPIKNITMAKAELNNGQVLYAVNDFFIGQRTHVSARYQICFQGKAENHSSSGLIISTGAGSTGWFRSIVTGAASLVQGFQPSAKVEKVKIQYPFAWDANHLVFSVREPFISKISSADIVFGKIHMGEHLEIVSQMPQNGVIFSDGIESDYLEFNSSMIARIGIAEKKVRLASR